MEDIIELEDIHIKVFPKHISFLKTIDNNVSNAARKVFDSQIYETQNIFIERMLLIFAFGLVFVILGTMMYHYILFIAMEMAGIFFIVYSLIRIIRWKLMNK